MFDKLSGMTTEATTLHPQPTTLHAQPPSPAQLSDTDLIDSLVAVRTAESALARHRLALIAELAGRRVEHEGVVDECTASGIETAEAEIGAALTQARAHAGRQITLALALRDRLPAVDAALAAGLLDEHRAEVIARRTATVTTGHLAAVERAVLDEILADPHTPGSTALTGRRLAAVVDRIVMRHDPDGVRARRLAAHRDRYLHISAAEDAMSLLVASLPAHDGRKLDARLRELADTVCPNDPRTFTQRHADAMTALVDGLDHLPCTCGRDDCTRPTGPGVTARKPLVHVVMLASTLDGHDDEPAHLDGHGLIDADHARDLAADAEHSPVRPPGTATGDPHRYRPGRVLDDWIRAVTQSCHWLHCDIGVRHADLDHRIPFDHHHRDRGGRTTAANLQPYCRNHHRLKHTGDFTEQHDRAGVQHLIAPTGHRYRTRNPGFVELLGHHSGEITDPGVLPKRRRTRAENNAARVRAERRQNRQRRNRVRADVTDTGRCHADPDPPPF